MTTETNTETALTMAEAIARMDAAYDRLFAARMQHVQVRDRSSPAGVALTAVVAMLQRESDAARAAYRALSDAAWARRRAAL